MNKGDSTMTLDEITNLAKEEFSRCNLVGWWFQFHAKKRAVGTCDYNRRIIYFSKYWTNIKKEQVLDTIRHEIAHAFAGWEAGHGARWKQECIRVGANPSRFISRDNCVNDRGMEITVKKNFVYSCPCCGLKKEVFRRSKRMNSSACSRCCKTYNNGKYDKKFAFVCHAF